MFAFLHSSFHILTEVINTVPPIDLLGIRLLQTCPQPALQPPDVPREILTEAVTEIIDYTARCTAAARRLSQLAPVPVTDIYLLEFGL